MRRFATEVTVMVHGRVLATGAPVDIMNSVEIRSVYLGAAGQARFGLTSDHA